MYSQCDFHVVPIVISSTKLNPADYVALFAGRPLTLGRSLWFPLWRFRRVSLGKASGVYGGQL